MALLAHTFVGSGKFCEAWIGGNTIGDLKTTGTITMRTQCGYPPERHVGIPPAVQAVEPENVGYLTESEIRAIDLAAELWNLMVRDVMARGLGRNGDASELAAHIHGIQQMVMSNAAARAYPSRFRLIGGERLAPPRPAELDLACRICGHRRALHGWPEGQTSCHEHGCMCERFRKIGD
jgi:hypothetical protein